MTPVLARYLGAASFGRYVIVMTLVAFATLLADAGLSMYAQRELSARTARPRPLRRQLWRSRIIVSVVVTLVAVLVAGVAAPSELRLPVLVGLAGLPALSVIAFLMAELTADLAPATVAHVDLLHRLLTLCGVVVAVASGGGLVSVLVLLVAGQYLGAFAGLAVRRRRRRAESPAESTRAEPVSVRSIIRGALPLSLIPLLTIVHSRTDVIVLAIFRSDVEVGIYGVMYRGIEVMLGLLTVASGLLLTIAARTPLRGRVSVRRHSTGLIVGAAVMMLSSGIVLATPLLVALGGRSFLISVSTPFGAVPPQVAFALLLGAFGFMGYGIVNASLLIAWGAERNLFAHFILLVMVHVALTLFLVPAAGLAGAATATLLAEMLGAWNSRRLVGRLCDRPSSNTLMRLSFKAALVVVLAGVAVITAPVPVRFGAVAVFGLAALELTHWRRGAAAAVAELEAHAGGCWEEVGPPHRPPGNPR